MFFFFFLVEVDNGRRTGPAIISYTYTSRHKNIVEITVLRFANQKKKKKSQAYTFVLIYEPNIVALTIVTVKYYRALLLIIKSHIRMIWIINRFMNYNSGYGCSTGPYKFQKRMDFNLNFDILLKTRVQSRTEFNIILNRPGEFKKKNH